METKRKVKPRVDREKPKTQKGGKGQAKQAKPKQARIIATNVDISPDQTQTVLLESESQFRILFDNLPVGIGVADLAGNLLVFNNAMLKPGGYSRKDIARIGNNVAALYYDPQQRAEVLALVQKQGFLKEHPVKFKRKDGTPYDTLLSLTPITFRGKPCLQALAEDVSERKQAEEQLKRRVEELNTIYQSALLMQRLYSLDQLVPEVIHILETMMNYEYSVVLLIDETTSSLYPFAASERRRNPQFADAGKAYIHSLGIRLGQGITGWVAQNGQSVRLGDVRKDPRYYPAHEKIRSELCVPLKIGDQIIGVINVETTKPAAYTETDQHVLETVAAQIAASVQNARMFEAIQHELEERRRVEDALHEREYHLQSLLRLSRNMERAQTYSEALNAARDEVRTIVGYQNLWVYLLTEDKKYFKALVASGFLTEAVLSEEEVATLTIRGDRMLEQISEAKEIVVVEDARTDERTDKDIVARLGNRTIVNIPIFLMDKRLGAVGTGSFGDEGVRVPTKSEEEYLSALASHMAVTFDRIHWLTKNKQAEEQLRLQSAALNAAANSIIIANREGIIEWVNPAYTLLTGYTMDEVIGKNPRFLKSGFHDQTFYKNMWNTVLSGRVWHSEVINKRKDGSLYNVDETITPLVDRNDQVTHFIGISQDITERKRAEGQIKNQLEHLNALHSIDKAISSSFDLRTTLQVLLNEVIAQLKVDAASVLLFNNATMTLDYTASRGFHSNAIQHTKLKPGEGYAGRIIAGRQTIHIPDLSKVEGKLADSLSLAGENFIAYIGAPLIVKGQILGVLEIFQRAPIDSDPEWFGFLETLAGQAAIAIDSAQLFENLQRSNFELTLSYDATIEGWSRAMDLRDHETEGHTKRVTDLTLKLARQMGIPEADILHIRRGALLHDIGKMGIPDSILHKADQLTELEWEVMHMHTIYAYEMLTPIPYLKPALDIPRYHHEKWDGTGHPHGLKGEEIPLPARIFAIVDVWDALTSDRPYRKAWSRERAIEFIKSESGKHFDPNVAKAFLTLTSDE